MEGASHLKENRKSASIGVRLFVATVALDCSFSVDHARRGLETAFAQHFHELGRHRDLVVLLHPLLYSIQHFSGELKRPTTPYTYSTSYIVENSTSNS